MSITDVADRFFAAVEAGDEAALRALYADDVRIWHNFSNAVQPKDESIALLLSLQGLGRVRYTDIVRLVTDDTIAQQHVITITTGDGIANAIPAAIFLTIRDGTIVGLNEYVDSPQFTRGALGSTLGHMAPA